MASSKYSDSELLALSQRFPSTSQILTDTWDHEALDQLGYKIWKDLSESWSPAFEPGIPSILVTLDTIRYLLYLYDSERNWKSGHFDHARITGQIWDQEHRSIYEQSKR